MFEILYEMERLTNSYTEAPQGCITIDVGVGAVVCACIGIIVGRPQPVQN